MNVAPLHPAQRIAMIDKLGEGLSERAKDVMGFTLSDGHLRTCYEGLYGVLDLGSGVSGISPNARPQSLDPIPQPPTEEAA